MTECVYCGASVGSDATELLGVDNEACRPCLEANGHGHDDTELGACELCAYLGHDQTSRDHVANWIEAQGYTVTLSTNDPQAIEIDHGPDGYTLVVLYRAGTIGVSTRHAGERRHRMTSIVDAANLAVILPRHAEAVR
jgi:hypothetical protein